MKDELFETADFNLASTIVATVSAPIVNIDYNGSGKPRFTFYKEDVPDVFIDAYWQGELRVEPIVFGLSRQYLRNRTSNGPIDEDSPSGFRI